MCAILLGLNFSCALIVFVIQFSYALVLSCLDVYLEMLCMDFNVPALFLRIRNIFAAYISDVLLKALQILCFYWYIYM